MAEVTTKSSHTRYSQAGRVPQDGPVRDAVRELAARFATDMDKARPPARDDLQRRAATILHRLSLPHEFLGFTMVALSNAFWRPQFEAVSFGRRLLFLPACLRDRDACQGEFDSAGLNCVGCSDCVINDLKTAAEDLGYRVLIAEGTPAVVAQLLECDADALIGVACLDSLEKAFHKATELGVPHVAVPLIKDGCIDTAAETDEVLSLLRASRPTCPARTLTYGPLLRESRRLFEPDSLCGILRSVLPRSNAVRSTDAIAREWTEAGGKRFRPFVTLAAYAVAKHGAGVLSPDADISGLIPTPVKKIAVAIEVLHKASLAHDDIEDDDAFRYGRETLHKTYGTGPAINVGDYLIGLGYRLISEQTNALGADCVADILARLSAAHIELCRGQGEELLWQRKRERTLTPVDALSIYALKTAPAFEIALYAGLRAAGVAVDGDVLRRFTVYLGEAYQILNDIEDWREGKPNKMASGADALADRPTLLRAFAVEAGGGDELAGCAGDMARTRRLYEELGIFDKAEKLVDKLRARATASAKTIDNPALKDLLLVIMRIVL